ncbi:MAG TPA: alpha-(1-_3)-arabinofuranosyltransferase family protein, partial [Acidimicrobiales bacterium]|nr:alpha-(1->3)-arabinofuranosyltransferase family protein [Acidimicrobiales bacterium]
INPILVVATTLAPAAAAALASFGRHRARLLAGILLAVGLPVVVGQYPPDGSIPAARIVRWIFTNVPGTVGFRTTVKAGGLIVLGDVVCIGIGVAAARLRWRDWTLPAKLALVVAGCLVELVSIAPALSGHLWNQTWNIPSYWQQAASVVNRGPSTSRVLVVPGSNGGDYQWGPRSPDDILPSVLSRPYASRSTVSFAGDPAGNLMAGTDVAMNENTLPAGAVSVLARYLGASQVLVRNDQRYWELVGAPPHVIESEILADRGLAGRIDYGFAGQNTQPPSSGTSDIPPLQLFNVTSPTTIERAQPAGHLVLVDGDGFSLPSLASLGILDGSQPFEWMGSVTTASLEQAAADGATIVITDTNRRRSWGENKTNESFGPTLSANQAIDASQGQSLTLFQTRTATQTVTSLAGAASITGTGPLFTLQPYGGPFQAFDGDPNTAWLTGGFGETGMTLTIDFSAPRQISRFTITAAHSSPVSASTVLVTVGSRKIRVDLRPFPDATPISLPTTTSSSLSIQITGLAGHGTNQVGIAEVSIPGLRVRQLVELPTTFDQLFNSVDSTTQARLATAPLDVVMVRARSGTGVFSANEEANLDREFVLPQARNFSVTGVLDSIADLPTQTIDLLETARPGQPAPCFTVGFLDDTLLRVSLGEPVSQAITSGARVPLVGCDGAPIPLGPGAHFLETFPTIVLDQVVFMSAGSTPAAAAAPSVTVDSESPTAVSLTVGASSSPYYLVGGQAFNAGWQGTIDGRSLGPPVLIDGYTFGWRIPASGSHDILLSYGPQFTTTAAFLLSILALLGCGLILAWPFVRRRRRGAHSREAAPEAAKGARHTAEAVTSPPNGDTPGHDTAGHDTPGRDPAGRDPAGRDSPGTDTPKPTPVSAASRLRLFLVSRALPWLALAAALSVLDSYVGLGVAVLLGLALRFGASSRLLLRAGAVVLLGVPVALVIHHIPTLATVSPNFVMGNTIASHIAFAGLALAVTGLCLPDRDRPEPAHARGTRRASS